MLVYWLLCIAGTILPLSAFIPWLADNGLDPALFINELFSTRIGAFFGWDVIVSAVALLTFTSIEGRRAGVKLGWLAIPATLVVGVSLGLPLFLALREKALRQQGAAH